MTRYYLYCLEFSNGKRYIGLTSEPNNKRLGRHWRDAKYGSTFPVHCAIRKHGKPVFRVLCAGERDYIRNLEIRAIAAFDSQNGRCGYNVHEGGNISPNLGRKYGSISDAHKTAIKAANARRRGKPGRLHSPDSRAKISAAQKGRPGRKWSSESRAKASAIHKGKPKSLKQRANMRLAQKGRVISQEHRAKISASKKGKPTWNKGILGSTRSRSQPLR